MPAITTLKIGTRGSKLALAQSGWIKGEIVARYPDVQVELVLIKTKGDKVLDSPLSKIGGKGLFVKEIEEALIKKDVDLAVHSIKDVPAELPAGLWLPVFPKREDPRDAFLSLDYNSIADLPKGATIGTGSLRRSSQLLHLRPDINIVPLRGNVDTRLKRLESGDVQAIMLAAAGLKRLGLSDKIRQLLPPEEFLPAIGQGALGLELRQDDERLLDLLGFLNNVPTELTIKAERALLKKLEGGCQVPIAGHGRLEGDHIILDGMVAELDGSVIIRDELKGAMDQTEETGIGLAEKLLSSGADKILARIYGRE
ncbi:hydroxymethylbilane synthase [Deltaproteobacteria bacterium]|nr:hydroxymethylbilane synthase [Deltaproteobacteria bacterium]